MAIGNFDGFHVGHRMLVGRAVAAASSRGLRSVVLTFDRHPATIVRPESAPLLLTSVPRKLELLRASGVDEVVVLRFDEERASEPAEDFVEAVLLGELAARVVVVGASFRFGHGQKGDVALLETMGAELGFAVDCLDLVDADAGDGDLPVSSSRIRSLLADGRVEDAARLLGRPHELEVLDPGQLERAGWPGPDLDLAVVPGLVVPRPGRYVGAVAAAGGTGRPDAPRVGVRVPDDRPGTLVLEASREEPPDRPSLGTRAVVGFLSS